jgi:acyl carrier protein
MIPSIVVALDSVPLLPNGKIDRHALPDPFRNALRTEASREPPAPGMEQLIAGIWQSVLKIERVDAGDNFFELGGHSLLSLRVAQAVEQQTGFHLDPRALFFSDLRQIAALIGSEAAGASGGER